jgi:hypothetical protein
MKKKYIYISVMMVIIVLIFLTILYIQKYYSQVYFGCTDKGCGSGVTLIIDNPIYLEGNYKHEIEINNEKYTLYRRDYTIALIYAFENQTLIYLNNYLIEQLEETNQLKSLNINFFEFSNEGEILNKYSVQNYELIVEKYYPNGERCEPLCYKAEPIYLELE